MKHLSLRLSVLAAIAVVVGIGIGFVVQPVMSGDSVMDQTRKFSDVLSMAVKNYVEEVDTQKLTEAAIRGMLEELDPHSVYITAKEMVKVEEDFRGSFDGDWGGVRRYQRYDYGGDADHRWTQRGARNHGR